MHAAASAWAPACRTALWVIRMVLPITLGVAVLEHLGVIGWISDAIAPLFSWVGLPGSSGLVFLTAALSNNYAAVAVIATIGFGYRDVLLLSVMALICHNLPIESVVQKKAGASAVAMTLLRIGAAFGAAALLNTLLPSTLNGSLLLPASDLPPTDWSGVVTQWVKTTLPLCLMIGVIIIALNTLQRILQEFNLMSRLSAPLRPLMAFAGLPRSTSFLWIICNVVGLTYGSAAMIDEIERGGINRHDSRLLNTHVALSHSLLEDTLIFYSIGVGLFWLLIPRFLLAVCAVWIQRGVTALIKPTMQHSAKQ